MNSPVTIYDPIDVLDSIAKFKADVGHSHCTILDPWYNKGVGGVRDDYIPYINKILSEVSCFSDHIYLWGFPEIIAHFVPTLPKTHTLTAWLTWYYKNNPSVIRGWRSSQMTCLHLSKPNTRLYPEHFLTEAQLKLKERGKLRYIPGPTSVIEAALLVGFIGKKEKTGHPSQKPLAVYEKLIKMATTEGDMVFDPMCGSGTTGQVCVQLNRSAIISDINPEYVEISKKRLECLPPSRIGP